MLNFFELINDILMEKDLSILDLDKNNIVSRNTFYDFSKYTPSLNNAINIANYLEISLDYLIDNTSVNTFKKYKTNQTQFYKTITSIMTSMHISQSKLAKDIGIARNSFSRWKNGVKPKFSTVIDITKYLNCMIDDLLETEK